MYSEIQALCFVLILGLALTMAGCSKKKEPTKPQDLESIRASLRQQVASGKLTHEEAVVKLAEATKEAKFGSRGRGKTGKKAELSPALDALGKELKERMAKGELTEEEAKAAWMEAAGKAKAESSAKGTKDSAKETE